MSEADVARIDELVADTEHASRTAFIVAAINRLVDELEAERIDRQIVEGYTRIPQTAEEADWAEWSTAESLREEPW
ncbi:MAG: hypothetical protein U0R50_11065 [Gaiellales bacterium]